MMHVRTVKIGALEPGKFNAIRVELYEVIPFAMIDTYYNERDSIGIFTFSDADYIPECMKPYVIPALPPGINDSLSITILNNTIKTHMRYKQGDRWVG